VSPPSPLSPRAAEYARALRLLDRGAYREGWAAYEARIDLSDTAIRRPGLSEPEWKGERLDGKRLVVWPEQGLGDKIMFARFIPLLAAGEIVVLCEPALERLFKSNLAAQVVPATGATEFPDPDAWVLYGSLPHRLGLEAIPAEPYLRASPQPRLARGARIGVCAAGNPIHPNDANRSLPADQARRLLGLSGAMSLQVQDTGARDLLETAGIVAALDLVITVDTAVAHLAGALGKPVWILLPHLGRDWRWGGEGETTAWYPSARLFRQSTDEPWPAVLDRVLAAAT
jgi:hypothetical protein